jgi:hypothetical protein
MWGAQPPRQTVWREGRAGGEGWGEGPLNGSTGMMVDILDRHDSRQFWLCGDRFVSPSPISIRGGRLARFSSSMRSEVQVAQFADMLMALLSRVVWTASTVTRSSSGHALPRGKALLRM